MVMIFPLILDNKKVVGSGIIFGVAKDQKFCPSGFKYTKRIRGSAAVMSRLECFV